MRTNRSALVAAAALCLVPARAVVAATIEPIDDRSLVDRASLVVVGTLEEPIEVVRERPTTDWPFAVDRVLKGALSTGRILVRLPGGPAPNGLVRYVPGTPPFAGGRRAILFLGAESNGAFVLADLFQGSFLEVASGGRRFALRDFNQLEVVGRGGRRAVRPPLHDFERFANWIEDRSQGRTRPRDYLTRPRPSEQEALTGAFTLWKSGANNMRWTAFDNGFQVPWWTYTSPLPGLTGGGVTEVQAALAAWNNDPTTPIALVYAGTDAGTGGTDVWDDRNVVLWNDPTQEMPGPFVCGQGGTYAHANVWLQPTVVHTFNGAPARRIVGGDVVFNDGIECKKRTSPNYRKLIEHIAAHEFGHTLGIAHSSDDYFESNGTLRKALMYRYALDDGRGAVLNSDDVAALQTLYRPGGAIGGGGGPKPPPAGGGCPAGTAPDTLCLLRGRFQITGTWQNQFDGSLGVLKPIPNSDLSGFFYFTDRSNVELIVKILDFGTEIKVFYSQLTNLKFTLSVKDTATGKVKNYSNTAGDCGAIDPNFGGAAAAASTPLGAAGACAPSSSTLCLLGNRFAVSVDWRNQFNGASGSGRPKSLSLFTGAFAFDDPANLEILIKTLDFGDKVLVLYGSLSNFEYTLHVTDTVTGKTKDYRNPAGNYCGGLDPQF